MIDFVCTCLDKMYSPTHAEGMQVIGTNRYHWHDLAVLSGSGTFDGIPYLATRLPGSMLPWMDRHYRTGGFIVHVSDRPWIVTCSQLRHWLISHGVTQLIASTACAVGCMA